MPETPWSCQLALWRWTSDCWDVPRVYGRHLVRFRCWQRGQAREALLKSAKNGTLAAAVSAVHSAHKDRVHSMSHSLRRRGMWRAFSKLKLRLYPCLTPYAHFAGFNGSEAEEACRWGNAGYQIYLHRDLLPRSGCPADREVSIECWSHLRRFGASVGLVGTDKYYGRRRSGIGQSFLKRAKCEFYKWGKRSTSAPAQQATLYQTGHVRHSLSGACWASVLKTAQRGEASGPKSPHTPTTPRRSSEAYANSAAAFVLRELIVLHQQHVQGYHVADAVQANSCEA